MEERYPSTVKLVGWAGHMVVSNRFLQGVLGGDYWELQEPGTVSLPDFIELKAKGKAKMEQGQVYLLK